MQIFSVKNDADLSLVQKNTDLSVLGCVTALGFFDGVHIAHRALINEARLEAKRLSLPLTIFTFSSNSAALKANCARLFTDEEKLSELKALGADVILVFDFDFIKNLSAEEFVNKILVTNLNTHTAFCGFNFRFGKGASADTEALKNLLANLDRSVVVLPEQKLDGELISSSLVRARLSNGELLQSAKLLGKPFFIDGKVSHGLGLGKKLGIPTVNLDIKNGKFTLPNGVYYTVVDASGKLYSGITNIGNCPTFNERETHTETYILNYNGDLYGSKIRVYFIERLRDEIKFSSKEELIMQINIDKNRALALEKEIRWQEIGLSLQ